MNRRVLLYIIDFLQVRLKLYIYYFENIFFLSPPLPLFLHPSHSLSLSPPPPSSLSLSTPQKFITPESSEQTKMGLDNIAMVWAPNFLRCPSDDHVLIFENTRKEMAFVRLLLKNIDPHLST